MQCIRLHWRRSVQGESRWLFFLCPTGSGQTESSGQYIFRPDPSGEALSDGRDNAQTSDHCCHGQANHCFRPDKCVKNRRGHTVHIRWQELLPGVFGQAATDKFSISEVCSLQHWNLSAAHFQSPPATKQKRRAIFRSPLGRWIQFVWLQWECGHRRNLTVNQFVQHQFLCLCPQAVHVLHPCHLILLLVRGRVLFQKLRHGLLHPVL